MSADGCAPSGALEKQARDQLQTINSYPELFRLPVPILMYYWYKMKENMVLKPKKNEKKNLAPVKVQYDKDLDALSGTILFPEKLSAANKFLKKVNPEFS